MTNTNPKRPLTLAIDVGGTGVKASVLDSTGKMVAERVRVATTYPFPQEKFLADVDTLVAPMPSFDRVSVGFPGVVRQGVVVTAPHFVTVDGPGSKLDKDLLASWTGFRIADVIAERLKKPVRVINDAEMQGLAVVEGHGLELVVTLGTGVGSALFLDGKLMPHIELAHQPFRKGGTYNDAIGDAAMKHFGMDKWRKLVVKALANFHAMLNYDTLYLGGGNAQRAEGFVDEKVKIVDNVAGILGGIKLWDAEIL